jgi:hypothetical protein
VLPLDSDGLEEAPVEALDPGEALPTLCAASIRLPEQLLLNPPERSQNKTSPAKQRVLVKLFCRLKAKSLRRVRPSKKVHW